VVFASPCVAAYNILFISASRDRSLSTTLARARALTRTCTRARTRASAYQNVLRAADIIYVCVMYTDIDTYSHIQTYKHTHTHTPARHWALYCISTTRVVDVPRIRYHMNYNIIIYRIIIRYRCSCRKHNNIDIIWFVPLCAVRYAFSVYRKCELWERSSLIYYVIRYSWMMYSSSSIFELILRVENEGLLRDYYVMYSYSNVRF
jgi:hypothetical protein